MPREQCIRCGNRVPTLSLLGNMGITIYKIALGLFGNSKALIADGIHSFTDVIGTSVIILSRRVARKPNDETHAYGYGKVEFMGAIFIYVVLLVIASVIGLGGIETILSHDNSRPHFVTLLGGGVSVLYNFIMYHKGHCAGRHNNSPAILANAQENRADAISSIAVMIGIAASIWIHPLCDPIGAIIVALIIFTNSVVQLREAIGGLMDRSLPPDTTRQLRRLALANRSVVGVNFIKSRQTGTRYWVDIGIQVDGDHDVYRADKIAAAVRSDVMRSSDELENVEVFVAALPPASARS